MSCRYRVLCAAVVACLPVATFGQQARHRESYTNPLRIEIPDGDPAEGLVDSCADPSVIRAEPPGDLHWYAYCTADPLNDDDRDASGAFRYRLMPILRSYDLVNWTYVGHVFQRRPDWLDSDALLWAPESSSSMGSTTFITQPQRPDCPVAAWLSVWPPARIPRPLGG